jgi:hypothetical protein
LDKILTTNPALNDYSLLKNGPLAPGESFTMALPGTLAQSLTNVATAVGTPVLVDGTKIVDLLPVTDDDESRVIVATTRSTDKDPYVPTPPGVNGTVTECMLPHWRDSGKKSPLVCTAKEVYLDNVRNKNRTRCIEGKTIKVDISADVMFNTDRYDPAFFVALDGGNAMTGKCLLKGFEANQNYMVVDQKQDTKTVGAVVFGQDFRGGNDKCGDVIINGGGGAKIRTSIVNTEVQCVDRDNDGSLDVAVCFSWRVPGTDGLCTLTRDDPLTQGSLADVFPGTPSKCFCFVYNVDDITVDPVPNNKFDSCIPAKSATFGTAPKVTTTN